jgi:hypothetical protein
MSFNKASAERRLNATQTATTLVEGALGLLDESGVTNAKVKKALTDALVELAAYRNTTRFAIRKRQERAKRPWKKEQRCQPSIS